MTTTAAERKAAERINRQVAPWRYRAELKHAIGLGAHPAGWTHSNDIPL
jgi:hypothetical protein